MSTETESQMPMISRDECESFAQMADDDRRFARFRPGSAVHALRVGVEKLTGIDQGVLLSSDEARDLLDLVKGTHDVEGEGVEYCLIQPCDLVRLCQTVRQLYDERYAHVPPSRVGSVGGA